MRFVKGWSSLLVSHFFANLSDKFIPPKNKDCSKLSYTLLIWSNYARIYVEIYASAKVVFGFNFPVKDTLSTVGVLDKNVLVRLKRSVI
jgi:hypothetical protein